MHPPALGSTFIGTLHHKTHSQIIICKPYQYFEFILPSSPIRLSGSIYFQAKYKLWSLRWTCTGHCNIWIFNNSQKDTLQPTPHYNTVACVCSLNVCSLKEKCSIRHTAGALCDYLTHWSVILLLFSAEMDALFSLHSLLRASHYLLSESEYLSCQKTFLFCTQILLKEMNKKPHCHSWRMCDVHYLSSREVILKRREEKLIQWKRNFTENSLPSSL